RHPGDGAGGLDGALADNPGAAAARGRAVHARRIAGAAGAARRQAMSGMSSEPLLSVRGLAKRFGGLLATDGVDLDVMPGELHALIGPNGAGKTTLIAQLFGELRQDAGAIRLEGEEVGHLATPERVHRGLGRTFQ